MGSAFAWPRRCASRMPCTRSRASATGSIRLQSLFLTLPTRALTGLEAPPIGHLDR
jgi:hypothetical protein